MARRKAVSDSMQTMVLTKSCRRCCLCFGIDKNSAPVDGQIAHLDQNADNNSFDNLAWLCLWHHNAYDSQQRQAKGLTISEVKHHRDHLYQWLEELPPSETGMSAQSREFADLITASITEAKRILASKKVIPGRVCRPYLVVHRAENGMAREPDQIELDFQAFVQWQTRAVAFVAKFVPGGTPYGNLSVRISKLSCEVRALEFAIASLDALQKDLADGVLQLNAIASRPIVGDHSTTTVLGDGNFVTQGDNVTITVKSPKQLKLRKAVIPGTLATDCVRHGYLEYLIDRYMQLKKAECNQNGEIFRGAVIRVAYRREFRFNISDTPLVLFEKAAAFLQRRIRGTILGRVLSTRGQRLFCSFEEFATKASGAVNSYQ